MSDMRTQLFKQVLGDLRNEIKGWSKGQLAKKHQHAEPDGDEDDKSFPGTGEDEANHSYLSGEGEPDGDEDSRPSDDGSQPDSGNDENEAMRGSQGPSRGSSAGVSRKDFRRR